jgi:hypothetical protein
VSEDRWNVIGSTESREEIGTFCEAAPALTSVRPSSQAPRRDCVARGRLRPRRIRWELLNHQRFSRWGEYDLNDPVGFTCAYLAGDSSQTDTLCHQLRKADEVDERHLVLCIGIEHTDGLAAVRVPSQDDEVTLPTTTPTLPEPIDGLWLTSMSPNGQVIGWLPNVGWVEG